MGGWGGGEVIPTGFGRGSDTVLGLGSQEVAAVGLGTQRRWQGWRWRFGVANTASGEPWDTETEVGIAGERREEDLGWDPEWHGSVRRG